MATSAEWRGKQELSLHLSSEERRTPKSIQVTARVVCTGYDDAAGSRQTLAAASLSDVMGKADSKFPSTTATVHASWASPSAHLVLSHSVKEY